MECPITSALHTWKSARTLLSDAIQSYLSASNNLYSLCIMPPPCDISGLRGALEAIASELESIALEIEAQRATSVLLAATRNKLAPINGLPPEILTNILMQVEFYCVRNAQSVFHDPAGVCSYWRQVALRTPGIWTHVDVGPGTPSKLTKLLFERASGHPVYLHLYEPSTVLGSFASKYETERIIRSLTPYMHFVRGLEIESRSRSRELTCAILNLWLQRGDKDATRLVVSRSELGALLTEHATHKSRAIDTESHSAREMLQSLSVLHLQEVQFDWQSRVYCGLVDLRLDFSCNRPSVSVSQFAEILSANPRLETLKLNRLVIVPMTDGSQPSPVLLASLTVLNLLGLQGASLAALLPVLTLPSAPANLSVGIRGYSAIEDQLLDFFNRSNMTLLFWRDDIRPSFLFNAVGSIQSLRTLIVDFELSPNALGNEDMTQHQSPRSLLVPSVIFLSAGVDLKCLDRFVEIYGITDLRLENCRVDQGYEGTLEDVRNSLLRSHPGLVCSLSDIDSTRSLACRTMFEPDHHP